MCIRQPLQFAALRGAPLLLFAVLTLQLWLPSFSTARIINSVACTLFSMHNSPVQEGQVSDDATVECSSAEGHQQQ